MTLWFTNQVHIFRESWINTPTTDCSFFSRVMLEMQIFFHIIANFRRDCIFRQTPLAYSFCAPTPRNRRNHRIVTTNESRTAPSRLSVWIRGTSNLVLLSAFCRFNLNWNSGVSEVWRSEDFLVCVPLAWSLFHCLWRFLPLYWASSLYLYFFLAIIDLVLLITF